jgi:hypothetical protein
MPVIVDENDGADCAIRAQSPRDVLLKLYPQTSEAKLPRKTKQLKYANEKSYHLTPVYRSQSCRRSQHKSTPADSPDAGRIICH